MSHECFPGGGVAPRGMAVVAVLMVVAVISVLAAALLGRQSAALRAAQAEQTWTQARWLLRGEIGRAQALLRAEGRREVAVRLDGAWHVPVTGRPLGTIEGAPARAFTEIIDEQARFNLRNLVKAGAIDPAEAGAFQRLCALVGVPAEQAAQIARRVATSLVDAEAALPGVTTAAAAASAAGSPVEVEAEVEVEVEDDTDLARRWGLAPLPPHDLTPRLRLIDDLLGAPGIAASSIERLRPFVTVLPQRTWINANTASAEVLAAWVPGLSVERARAVLKTRDQGQWFVNRGDFVRRLQMPEIDDVDVLIGITSEWFRVSTALRMTRTTLLMQALLHDDKQSLPRVVWTREGA